MNDLQGVLPVGKAASALFSWVDKWVVREPNTPKKDGGEFTGGSGELASGHMRDGSHQAVGTW